MWGGAGDGDGQQTLRVLPHHGMEGLVSINVTHDFIRNLTRGIRSAYGTDLKNTQVMELVAAALGWKADALMHKLKRGGRPDERSAFEASGDLPTAASADWPVRRHSRETQVGHEYWLAARQAGDADVELSADSTAEIALIRAVFGDMKGATELLSTRSPDTPYSSLAWGVVTFMLNGDSPEARAMVEAGISQDACLFMSMVFPRAASETLFGGGGHSERRSPDDWQKLREIVKHFPLDNVVDFIRAVAVAADICLVRAPRKGGFTVKRNAGTGYFLEPAVPVSESVTDDGIVCLFDGKIRKMMTRHLRASYNMDPDDYRRFWNLPAAYPMAAQEITRQTRH